MTLRAIGSVSFVLGILALGWADTVRADVQCSVTDTPTPPSPSTGFSISSLMPARAAACSPGGAGSW